MKTQKQLSDEISDRYFNIIVEMLKSEESNKEYQKYLNNINKQL